MVEREAKFYRREGKRDIRCVLCPHACLIQSGKTGKCRVRRNNGSFLVAENYGRVAGFGMDPVEKKPLYHFHPGKKILSVGTYGCNMECFFCQNCEISQHGSGLLYNADHTDPDTLLRQAKSSKECIGIAFTYNEPAIFFEYMEDIAQSFKESGLKTAMVSNGFISKEPLEELTGYIDAFNIDLKAFDETFYKEHTAARLSPVLNTIQTIAKKAVHLEISFLLIPGLNDDPDQFKNMLAWLSDTIGKNTILHISKYFPRHRSSIPPTPVEMIREFTDMAREYFDFVYPGNIPDTRRKNSYCHKCGQLCIDRTRGLTHILLKNMADCPNCGEKFLNLVV